MPFTKKKKKTRKCIKCKFVPLSKTRKEDICDSCLKLLEEEIQIKSPVE